MVMKMAEGAKDSKEATPFLAATASIEEIELPHRPQPSDPEDNATHGTMNATNPDGVNRSVGLLQSLNRLTVCQKILLATTFAVTFGAGVAVGCLLIHRFCRSSAATIKHYPPGGPVNPTVTSFEDPNWLDSDGNPITTPSMESLFSTPQSTSRTTAPSSTKGIERSTRRSQSSTSRSATSFSTHFTISPTRSSTQSTTASASTISTTAITPGPRPAWISQNAVQRANQLNDMKSLTRAVGQASQTKDWSLLAALLLRQAEVCRFQGGAEEMCQSMLDRASRLESKVGNKSTNPKVNRSTKKP